MAFQHKLQDLEKSFGRMRTGRKRRPPFFPSSKIRQKRPDLSDEGASTAAFSREFYCTWDLRDTYRDARMVYFTVRLGLGCANYEVSTRRFCGKDSTKQCSACKLVGYCSEEWPPQAQQEHWRLDKRDCKGSLQVDGWPPSWMVDRREPRFISNDFDRVSFGMGMIFKLLRNIAAYDVLNLSRNEGFDNVRSKDLSLATVNELPNDYSGSLSVVFNDHNPIVVVRNLVMLLSLGSISDKSDTAEQALHLWYSLFLPSGYPVFVLAAIQGYIEQAMKGSTIGLTSTTTLKPIIT
ncbi:hypothetical protein C8J56DRAFT_1100805 [Mycena floridula]|nr:hypothetical protein C8J56DRAFT_1100805 [Mycena floridula]